jgi:Tfp pilus assembly protein PilN
MRAVNLMPRDERKARLELGRLPLFAAAGGIVVVTAAAFFVASSASSSAEETRAEARAVEAAIAQLPKGPDTAVNAGTLVQERSNRVAALAAALDTRTAFDRVLVDLSRVLPKGAWLTQLEAASVAPSTPADAAAAAATGSAGGEVTIQGAAFSHETVAAVLGRLAVVPTLSNVRLTSTALVDPSADQEGKAKKRARTFISFTLAASIRSAGS